LFALLTTMHPGKYRPTQVRTLQRHIAAWRALAGPEKTVVFEQVHEPGEAAQSDFTHMEDLGVTIVGQPFPHLLFHLVLTYSNVEAIHLCFGEPFEALAEGIEAALWQMGGVPRTHRTDHLSAAVQQDGEGREVFTQRYQALMRHYAMEPTWNNVGVAHENGDVEQSHHRFKLAVDQALRVRGSREFPSRAAYQRFLDDVVRNRNLTRQVRFAVERDQLRPLPAMPLAPCREVRVTVSRFSTMQVLGNTYSVPSRLIGTPLLVRVRAETLEGYVGSTRTFVCPRLQGKGHHVVTYRHVIWSLVRKPGAFAHYRYHDDLFPSLAFRQCYDSLRERTLARADREYVRILYLAATTCESEVEAALHLLHESDMLPLFDTVRALVHQPKMPQVRVAPINFAPYDQLLAAEGQVAHE
jgi:hypothetical protein